MLKRQFYKVSLEGLDSCTLLFESLLFTNVEDWTKTVNGVWRVWSWVMTLQTHLHECSHRRMNKLITRTHICTDEKSADNLRHGHVWTQIYTQRTVTRDNRGTNWTLLLNKTAATRFTPDAIKSQKRRSGRDGGLLTTSQNWPITAPPRQQRKVQDFKKNTHKRMCYQRLGAVLARLVPNYCHYTLFSYLCVHTCTKKWLSERFWLWW